MVRLLVCFTLGAACVSPGPAEPEIDFQAESLGILPFDCVVDDAAFGYNVCGGELRRTEDLELCVLTFSCAWGSAPWPAQFEQCVGAIQTPMPQCDAGALRFH